MEENNNSNPHEEKKPETNTEESIAQVFAEDVIALEEIEASEVDESDFSGAKKEDPENPSAENKSTEEKKDTEQPKETAEKKKSPEAEKKVDEKNAVVRKMFNPDTALLMFDILAKRGGRMATPDRPDYFRMSDEDRTDFSTLIRLTAEEEDWSAIPTKYLLSIAGAFWVFGKVYKWNKPHLWDEKEMGNKFVKKGNEKEVADAAVSEYIREKAKADSESGNKELKEMVRGLADQAAQQNKNIQNLLSIIQGNIPGADNIDSTNIHDTPFTEIPPEKILDGYDMDIIEFTENGALIDASKAGLSGFTMEGMKMGRPTNRDREIWSHFKQYHAWKAKHLKVA